MAKVLAVFGATGQQGGSVIRNVLADPEISKEYKIRAITRDPNSTKSKQLPKDVEVVQGDVLHQDALEQALAGVHTVFLMTTPEYAGGSGEGEFKSASLVADVAVKQGVQYIIFSTLTAVAKLSGGKHDKVGPFDDKEKAEEYIKTLPIKSAFFCGGYFMENLATQPFLFPEKLSDGSYVLTRNVSPNTLFPYVDACEDVGKFVTPILAEPEKYQGKKFCAAEKLYTIEEVAAIISKTTGKTVKYQQKSLEDYTKSLQLPPEHAVMFADLFAFQEDVGYFGPDSKAQVQWAQQNARGKLTTLEEYLTKFPLKLE